MNKSNSSLKWHRLDNTAKLFPIITNENLSNVFRVSCILKEEIDGELLQRALEDILPWFEGFNVRLRKGFFWYYFESNKRVPLVEKESTYPCQYIDPVNNRYFLFRVSYYGKRINLEVFHAITDGLGAMNFLKELTYRYIELVRLEGDEEPKRAKPSIDCILDTEDSYVKHYRKMPNKAYRSRKGYQLDGQLLYPGVSSVMHGHIDTASLKEICKSKNVSITKYLVSLLIWSIYKEYINEGEAKDPISINLPINLRSFFDSTTTMNFFGITQIDFLADGKKHSFDDILMSVSKQMDDNITKEKMQETIAYNVKNEKNPFVRFSPLALKYLMLQMVYSTVSKRNTMTLSNLGQIKVSKEYEDYIEGFNFVIGVSKKQKMKCGVVSYKDDLVVTFSSVLQETYLQRAFFRALASQGVKVVIESNGVINEQY